MDFLKDSRVNKTYISPEEMNALRTYMNGESM